jgi:hypothetical protein
MEHDRDLFMRLDEKVSNLCRSIDMLRAEMNEKYATKEWVKLEMSGMNQEPMKPIHTFLNSKAGITLLVVIGVLVFMGISALTDGTTTMTEEQVMKIIEQTMKG